MDKKFTSYKKQVLENLATLQDALSLCKEIGLHDPEELLYNRLLDMITECNAVEDLPELEEVILLAKDIETEIEEWLSLQGRASLELEWPSIPSP